MSKEQQLNIASIIDSAHFRKELIEAIESGKGIDYEFDGENEYPVDKYDEYWAFEEIINVLKKHLTQQPDFWELQLND